jgi:chitin disaccharide deacetylase
MLTRVLVRRLAGLKIRTANAFFQFHVGLLGALSRFPQNSFTASSTTRPQPQLLAERLGYEPGERLLIVHADDLAIAHAVNAAIVKGLGTGLINSASVMVPCPWFPEVAAFAREHPGADLGIHLTLTSERTACRWGPTAPRTKVPSLVDRQGYFHQTWTDATLISAREVELELRAQIDKAFDSGLRPTHLDSHQYRLQMSGPRLFEVYLRLGRKYNLPIFVARNWFAQFPYLQRLLTPRDVVILITQSLLRSESSHKIGRCFTGAPSKVFSLE